AVAAVFSRAHLRREPRAPGRARRRAWRGSSGRAAGTRAIPRAASRGIADMEV
ncbi:MAG: hypothetical protein AVDCRST_MAG67-2021, partial [uncultured Solirubrobacteraceae bacterium]